MKVNGALSVKVNESKKRQLEVKEVQEPGSIEDELRMGRGANWSFANHTHNIPRLLFQGPSFHIWIYLK